MKRLLPLVALAVVLSGFTLISFIEQTPRTRWTTQYLGAAYNTAVPEETSFSHCFKVTGSGSSSFGPAFFRMRGITCSWGIAGTGGTNGVDVKIVHEDAGIDCQCTLGACTATAATEMTCSCPTVVELGRTIMADGGEQLETSLCLQVDDATDCAGNPAAMSCSVDLFR